MPKELKESVAGYDVKVEHSDDLGSQRIALRVGGCFIHFQSVSSWQK